MKPKTALHRARSHPKTAPRGAEKERSKAQKRPDPALWGTPPEHATRFSLNQHFAGGSRKLGLRGQDGVVKYNWPLHVLSVDWVRSHWGSGAFQANWIVEENGKLIPRGRSRPVELDDAVPIARARNGVPVSIGVAGEPPHVPSPAPPAPATMPPQVVDMRVQAAEEIAAMRLRAEREINQQRLEWERTRAEERFARLEERIEELATRRGRYDDDDDEPDEWQWLKDLAREAAPTLKELVPALLAKLTGGGNQLPSGG